MQWNIGVTWDKENFSADSDWKKIANTCKKNIKSINENTKIMTSVELKQFINDDYSKQIDEMYIENDIKI